jgi:hypothetical protein
MMSYPHVVYVTCNFCYMFSLGSSSGNTVVFGYICEHYTPNHSIYRCIYQHKYIGHEDNVQTWGLVRVRLYVI